MVNAGIGINKPVEFNNDLFLMWVISFQLKKPSQKLRNGYFLYASQENCEWFLLAETNDPLDQRGAVRHRVGPKDHEFQPKKSQTCFWLGVSKEMDFSSSSILTGVKKC